MATKSKAQGKGGNGARTILFTLVGPVVLYYLHSTVVFLFFALLPTFATLVAERRAGRYAWIAVGGLNFTGAAPFLLELWFSGHHMAGVDRILSVTTLMIMYGAALLGGLLFMAIPLVVAVFLTVTASHRVATLKMQQRRLVEQWGPELAQREDREKKSKAPDVEEVIPNED
ncbi:MAG: hypothetical protein FD149_2586 [Rhodospirillaceae bacterium]|nr:MAG: hypothetical protein FD149_2586 [Rhodospirillaceae bacterium]